jgi:hypothetical protein
MTPDNAVDGKPSRGSTLSEGDSDFGRARRGTAAIFAHRDRCVGQCLIVARHLPEDQRGRLKSGKNRGIVLHDTRTSEAPWDTS